MKKNYREIEFTAGQTIESAVNELKSYNRLVCGAFNGTMLYSDVDDVDSAFKKVAGKTKAEFDEAERKRSGEKARSFVTTHLGATKRICGHIEEYL